MIYFDHLPLKKDILDALAKLSIEYAFQPIFLPDGKTIYAREALMRPTQMTVTELIEQYMKDGNLHVLEVATYFGAMQEYVLRGYTEHVCLNSFPSERFDPDEIQAFNDYFGDMNGLGIVELLEYPSISEDACRIKKLAATLQDLQLAIDDYGSGLSNMDFVDLCEPDIVKIDRTLLSDLDKHADKLKNVGELVKTFHSRGIRVVAEGVETKEEFDCLVGLDVDYFQGYYLAMPE
ncbi:MAG: EAL domain-containing protein [Lachnospiraceae bacterium]|nr:EAL domain-containing protein [Lachnospiraceae bacterium]